MPENFNARRETATFAMSEVDAASQMTGHKSQMIRLRGRMPSSLWQKGALQRNKKMRRRDHSSAYRRPADVSKD